MIKIKEKGKGRETTGCAAQYIAVLSSGRCINKRRRIGGL